MKIRYISHSCFLFTSDTGIKLLVDPCNPSVMPGSPNITADAILVSHTHPDHSDCSMVYGASEIVSGAGKHFSGGVSIEGFLADHGTLNGEWLGMVICYKFQVDGANILHLSDMGVIPSDSEIAEFGDVDVLLVPVGGSYTLDPAEAHQVINKIKPTVTIPMHYATAGIDRVKYPLKTVDDFIGDRKNVKYIRTGEAELNLELLPDKNEIWVMSPA